MELNTFENYENNENFMINGTAVIDRNFEIVTANEEMYRFIGISKIYSFIDIIHQVDMDDFIEVVNSLRINQENTMVIRMKNIENSYRWVFIRIIREENPNKSSDEYIVVYVSDIISMKKLNDILNNRIQTLKHMMSEKDKKLNPMPVSENVFVSYNELGQYISSSLASEDKCRLMLSNMSIDNFDKIRDKAGDSALDDIYQTVIQILSECVSRRGVCSEKAENLFALAVKNINTELDLRAFIEHLRTRVNWECRCKYPDIDVTFSIGIVRYPDNSTNWNILSRKLKFAYERSVGKGGANYVIYREYLHGEITEEDINKEKQE